MVTEFRERASRMWPLLLFCGAGGGWVAYRMFVAPNEMMIPWFEIRPGNPVAWLALGLAALGAALGLHRMVIAPHRVVIAPHELRFGVRGRKRLDRAEVAGVEHRRGEVLLRLRDREATLRRLELLRTSRAYRSIRGSSVAAVTCPPSSTVGSTGRWTSFRRHRGIRRVTRLSGRC